MTNLHVKWTNRLSVRLTAAVVFVTLVISSASLLLGLRVQRGYLISDVVRAAAQLSDTIKSSTYHDMLEDRRDDAYRIMETIGRQDGIEKVRIFNKEGKVTFSTDRGEIGTLVDKRAESCYACHTAGQPIVRLAAPSRSRIYRARAGHRILGMVTPIYNEKSCYTAACHVHPEAQRVLGVVDIGISLAQIDRGVQDLQRSTIVLSSVAVLVLAVFMGFLVRRFVLRPVSQLVEATHKVATGDLDHGIDVHATDEIGILAASFNTMTDSLRRAQQNINELMGSLEHQVEERTAALRDAQHQLIQSEKMASLGKLSASIAHEINNPLSGILTTAKLLTRLAEDIPADESTRASFVRHLSMVERETQRCTAIVRNLLDFARQRELTLVETDANRAIEEALSLLSNQVTIQGISVEKHLSPLPAIEADFGQLRQAFVNVLLNACEAMSKGGTLTISSRVLPEDQQIEIECADTGMGIPPDHLDKILDPFFTTKEKGTGLGLSVVYGIVERHRGKLQVRSQVGKGTVVVMRFPTVGAHVEVPQRKAGGA